MTHVLYFLQDLSTFAMPLLDSDMNQDSNNCDDADSFRPRSGSAGLRNLFRKKHKSGDESKSGSHGHSPVSPQSSSFKMKNFLDAFRPRSKSDVVSAHVPVPPKNHHPRNSVDLPPSTYNVVSEERSTHSKSAGHQTPMSALLRRGSDEKVTPIGPEEYIQMFRERAYSDPRPKERSTVLATRSRHVSTMLKLLLPASCITLDVAIICSNINFVCLHSYSYALLTYSFHHPFAFYHIPLI